ncbi:MAG: GntR family transcriptional regulator [Burkholderiales bacterium]|nr:GntR family transcriptional regulator [Burkholderiales bacterium]
MSLRSLSPQPTLVEQVYEALLSEITEGKFGPEERLIQEELAEALGVSRQPVQQALLLLRTHGVLCDAPGRGLMVAPLDPGHVRDLYEIRSALDGVASAGAAERARETAASDGPAFIERGRAAVKSKSIARLIAADMDFHFFLYRLSGNPLIAEVSEPHWTYLRRAMGEVLVQETPPTDIWDEHEAILAAVIAGQPLVAERLSREHILHASTALVSQMRPVDSTDRRTASRGRRAARTDSPGSDATVGERGFS